MAKLDLSPNIPGADDFYAELLTVHDGLSRGDSEALNARLVLLLANHIGDREVLSAAMQAARAGLG